jgi:outer membrane protein
MKSYLTIILSILAIFFSVISFFQNESEIIYVNTNLVYEKFKMKSELETKYNDLQIIQQGILDSIKYQIQYIAENLSTNKNLESKFELLKKEYLSKENLFLKQNESLKSNYNNQIWTQINQYISDYGSQHNFDIILGATGEGNIMYAKKEKDNTEKIIEYINAKYSGTKK